MKVYDSLIKLSTNSKTAVSLGYFDGVHAGHRTVINAAIDFAKENNLESCVFTFKLPTEKSDIKGGAILSKSEKIKRIEKMGMQNYYCPNFESFCNLTPQMFVSEIIVKNLKAAHVFCGENFTFGKNKSGNVDTLKALCEKYGVKTHVVSMSFYNQQMVSSTRIRSDLQIGNMESVNEMLCEPYSVDFSVKHGKKIGSKMGYPTINQIYPEYMIQPKSGVYITTVEIDKKKYPAATGLGNRPTFNGQNTTCETFIINYSGNLYSEKIVVEFLKYLKPTVKFDSEAELENYIKQAVKSSLNYFKSNNLKRG